VSVADRVRVGPPEPMFTISRTTATAIVIADMIGVGVFTSLGFQAADITSGFSLILLWIVGGIVAICGALCYAELAAMFPRSSGEYNFLRQIYHPAFGFVAGWISATVGFAAPIALAAMAFGVYFQSVVPGAPPLLLGIGVIWLAALVHLSGLRFGGLFHNLWTALKLVLIAAFIVAGIAFGESQPVSFAPTKADLHSVLGAPFAISLVFVMYSYSGWNAATYIAGEMRDPVRDPPRAMLAGTAIVILLYVALNAVFLVTTPISELAGQLDVALIASKHVFGDFGGRVVGAFISLGLVSSISAMTWIGPRVTMTMGEDMAALRLFARKSAQGVPAVATIFQLLVGSVLLFTQSFEAVLDFIQFSLTLCSFFTVAGVIVLRTTRPKLERPYRAWGYPVTPIIFLGVTAFMMYYLVVNRPLQSLGGAVIMLAGLVIYYHRMVAAAVLAFLLGTASAGDAQTATLDDSARFLAGLSPAANSPLAALANTWRWQQHARFLDSAFGQQEKQTLSKIEVFSRTYLTEKHPTMLYMFSGPDFLYANSFFPSASTYVLSGLEEVGAVPPLTGLRNISLDDALRRSETALGSLLNFSFFITRDMKMELYGGSVYGTLPILYVFLARTGKTIHEVDYVTLDAEGSLAAANEGAKDANRRLAQSRAKGVKIVFSEGDGPPRTLYYFSTNLSDEGVASSGFLVFCKKLGVADALIKSASYLMHKGGFDRVRNFLLDDSATIVQDDSGIPLAFFDSKKWRLQPFGHYLYPIGEFPGVYQPRMTELFRQGNAIPIDFGIGYRWRRNESNLLLAQNISPPAGPPVLPVAQKISPGAAPSVPPQPLRD
jgi:APA family basic amino acid/polyamine antiporter